MENGIHLDLKDMKGHYQFLKYEPVYVKSTKL